MVRAGTARVARRFAAHLAVEFPAVVTRKVCGGNRTARRADTHAVLASVLRTIQKRQLDAVHVFSKLLRSPEPITALAPPPT